MSQEVLAVSQDQEILSVNLDEAGFIEAATKRLDQLQQVKKLALRLTNQQDWVDLGGKPYLSSSGLEKIKDLFKVGWSDMSREKLEREDARGKFYVYVFTAKFWSKTLHSEPIVAIGKRSSRDEFFAKGKEGWKPVEDIREDDVLGAAYTNLLANGISRTLGLRNFTWEEVQEFAKFKREDVSSVKYQKSASKATAQNVVTGLIEGTEIMKRGEYTIFQVVLDKKTYSTFSKTLFDRANELLNAKRSVVLGFKQGKYGLDLVSIDEKPATQTSQQTAESAANLV